VPRTYWVYILASGSRALYIGVTGDLPARLTAHRTGAGAVHTRRYRHRRLVHAEPFATAIEAIRREKQLKRWKREKKTGLIERSNPEWRDLAVEDLG
jgi:putative endonuclease